jgi:phage repressor protein C with HTH and peptisase S24 domain
MAPTLLGGDYVLIDLLRTEPEDGKVYAIAVGHNLAIKRVQLTGPDRLTVISDNPVYRPYDLAITDLKIIGQVIWACRTFV